MTNPSQKKGQAVYPEPDIWPNCPIDAATDGAMIAGEVYGVPTQAAPVVYGIAPHNHADNGVGAMWMRGQYVVRKKAGVAFNYGDRVTFELVALHDYWEADKSVATEKIHGYCLRAADAADTTMVIYFMGIPPFGVEPGP